MFAKSVVRATFQEKQDCGKLVDEDGTDHSELYLLVAVKLVKSKAEVRFDRACRGVSCSVRLVLVDNIVGVCYIECLAWVSIS